MDFVGMRGRVPRLGKRARRAARACGRRSTARPLRVTDERTSPDQLDLSAGRGAWRSIRRYGRSQVDHGQARLGIARDGTDRAVQRRRSQRERRHGSSSGELAAFTARIRPEGRAGSVTVGHEPSGACGRAGVRRPCLRTPGADARGDRRRGRVTSARLPRPRWTPGPHGGSARSRTRTEGSASAASTSRRSTGRSTSVAASCTTRRRSSSSSTGRRRRHGRSTRRPLRIPTGSRCAAGSAPRAGGSSTSPTGRSTAPSSTVAAVDDFLLEELERGRDAHARHRRDDQATSTA